MKRFIPLICVCIAGILLFAFTFCEAMTETSETDHPPVIGDGQYKICFHNWDDTILLTVMADEGEIPEYTGKTPTRPDDDEFEYEFAGWNEEIQPVSGDYDYYATYTAIALIPAWDGSVADGFAGGSGTESDPYLIEDGSQLAYLAQVVNRGNTDINNINAHFQLTQSINLGDNEWTPIGTGYDISGEMSTDGTHNFKGIFDGNGKTIINVQITEAARAYHRYFGLFGYVSDGTIHNLKLKNVQISLIGTIDYGVGALVGKLYKGTISNCSVSGSVKGEADIGGVVGIASGTLRNISADVDTTGNCTIGGICGTLYGEMEGCSSEGTVSIYSANGYDSLTPALGGLIGKCSEGSVAQSCFTGKIICSFPKRWSNPYSCGGLIGYCSKGSVEKCYATGDISFQYTGIDGGGIVSYVGGLIGRGGALSISDCYTLGNIDSDDDAGGLIGYLHGKSNQIARCYSAANLTTKSTTGGLIGYLNVDESTEIRSCIAFGNIVSSGRKVGGLIGQPSFKYQDICYCKLTDCYRPEYQKIELQGNQPELCNLGEALYLEDINQESFFTDRMGWSSDVWDFSELNVAEGKYPTLVN